jgi:hypothetical protein
MKTTSKKSPLTTAQIRLIISMSVVMNPRKAFGPDGNKVIRGVLIGCGAAIVIGI